MTRRDWLVLFMALEGAPDGLDPVRVQSALFLFAMESRVADREKYRFKPYDYGPMSGRIYTDLDALVDGGLIEMKAVPGKRWLKYRPTDAGISAGHRALVQAQSAGQLDAARVLQAIKRHVAAVSFHELLEAVDAAYPENAVRSVFRRPA